MKKILAICMAALLLLSAVPVSMALAEGAIGVVGSVDKATVCPGDTVTLTVSMENNPGLVAWRVYVAFDEAALTLTEQKAGDLWTAATTFGPMTSPTNAMFADAIHPDVEGDGAMAIFTFTVNDNYSGDVNFDVYVVDPMDFYDVAWGEFEVACEDASVSVGHTYDNACDADCNSCGAVSETAGHAYDNDCDADCNNCGAVREVAGHAYDNDCDADCNSCGAVRVVTHSYTYPCDQTCALCGELTNPNAAHNIVYMDAVAAGCHMTGNVEYWYCSDCGAAWTDEALTQQTNLKSVVIPAQGAEVTHFAAVEAACHYEGNIEYWYCAQCNQFWQDEALTQLTNSKNVIIGALGGDVQHVEAVAPGCHYNGNIEYWFCAECEQVWQDEALTQITNLKNVVVPAVGGETVHFDAVEPGCHYEGNIEYWYCAQCEQFWQDAALTQITNSKNVVVPALESTATKVEAKAPTCYENGNVEYWICDKCEQVWTDEALTQLSNIKNVQIAAAHTNLKHVEAVEAGCHYEGNTEYWVCYDCETWYADEALTQITNSKNVIVPAKGGDTVHMEAVEPGCHYEGNIEYWVCYECEQVWTDEALTQLSNIKNVIVPAKGGEVKHVEAKAATATENGNIEYWICEECEQVWTDEALTQLSNIKNVVVPATGETATTTKPGDEPGKNEPGKTGENTLPVVLAGMIALIAAAAVVVFSKKKA